MNESRSGRRDQNSLGFKTTSPTNSAAWESAKIVPQYFINQRVGLSDRMLLIYRSDFRGSDDDDPQHCKLSPTRSPFHELLDYAIVLGHKCSIFKRQDIFRILHTVGLPFFTIVFPSMVNVAFVRTLGK